MRIETCTSMGTTRYGANEDFAFTSQMEGCAAVLDGASGLTGKLLTGFPSDSAWFSSRLGLNLQASFQGKDVGILEALEAAGKRTAMDYTNVTSGKPVAREDEPSATLALVKWHASSGSGVLEAAVLGDCACVVHRRDGMAEVLEDDHLSRLDGQAIDRLTSLMRDGGLPFAEARERINDKLIENRLLRNRKGGYWIADISCEGYSHAVTKAMSLSDVQGVFLCTDGYANAVNMGVCSDIADLADKVRQGHGRAILDALREREAADSEMTSHPRFKISDDATYVYLQMGD